MNKKNTLLLWLIFIVSIFAIVTSMCYDYYNLKRMSAKVNAIITTVKITTDSDGDNYYNLEYEFNVNDKRYTGKYSSGSQYNVGDELIIKYDPNNPSYNFQESYDNSVISSVVSIVAVIVMLCELAYIEQKTVNKKKASVEEKNMYIKKLYRLISNITLFLFVITFLFTIYIINHRVMLSIGFLIYFSFGMMLIFYFSYLFLNKTISKLEASPDLLEEIKKCEEIKCETSSVYFADKHLIEVGLKLEVINYSDIILMSNEVYYNTNGPDSYYILIITKDYNKHNIANISLTNNSCHEKIIEELRKRVPEILEGYNKENKKIIKEMKKASKII